MIARISKQVTVHTSPEEVFAAITDWENQSAWMLGTVVKAGKLEGRAIGGTIEAFSGIGPLGFRDTMTITRWNPPHRCDVEHTGKLVRGTGSFIVRPDSTSQSVFIWAEQLKIPFGIIGMAGWFLVKPLFIIGLKISLRRFSRTFKR